MKSFVTILILSVALLSQVSGQIERRDRAMIIAPKNEFLDSIKAESARFHKKDKQPSQILKMDFSGIARPTSPDEFTRYPHTPPISQGLSGMCWCFSTTSFFESEIYRLTKREIKLSELYTVYWEYVEKARRFVQERGSSEFGQGSEGNAVPRIWKTYGIVPAEAYTGLKPGQIFHDHDAVFEEMNSYLNTFRNSNAWNEETTIATIRSILNHYLGEPPAVVKVEGKTMTPKEYLQKVVRLNLDEYIDFMSLMAKPYHSYAELEVPDNWWHSPDYYNVPVDEFLKGVKHAIRKGYTLCIGGDVSEAGIEGHAGIAVVPTFDIPSSYIDDNARQFRFSNNTSTDDHGVHLIGYVEKEGRDWYLIKDSGSGVRNNTHAGYYFYHEDYVKLKMLSFMVHKDAIADIMNIANRVK